MPLIFAMALPTEAVDIAGRRAQRSLQMPSSVKMLNAAGLRRNSWIDGWTSTLDELGRDPAVLDGEKRGTHTIYNFAGGESFKLNTLSNPCHHFMRMLSTGTFPRARFVSYSLEETIMLKYLSIAAVTVSALSVAGTADARSHHKRHHHRSSMSNSIEPKAGANSSPAQAGTTTPPAPAGKASTTETPKR